MSRISDLTQRRQAVAAYLTRAFDYAKRPVMKNVSGTQGATYVMNNAHIIKIPLNCEQRRQLEAMTALLELLKHQTAVKTPDLRVESIVGKVNGKLQEIVFGHYPMIQGHMMNSAADFFDRDKNTRFSLARQIGAFVADLHALSADEVSLLKLPSAKDYLHEVLFEDFKVETRDIPLFNREHFLNTVYDHVFEGCDSSVVCHMDLHVKNMCFDKSFDKLTGVFDFGRALKGPKELEETFLYFAYDEEMNTLRDGYERRGGTGFQSPQLGRVSKYLSPFMREKHMPALIERMKERISERKIC